MRDEIERTLRLAAEAREKADDADDRGVEQEWLTLAVILEELAHECAQFDRIADDDEKAAKVLRAVRYNLFGVRQNQRSPCEHALAH